MRCWLRRQKWRVESKREWQELHINKTCSFLSQFNWEKVASETFIQSYLQRKCMCHVISFHFISYQLSSFAWMLIYKAVNLWWKTVSAFCRRRGYLSYAQWLWPLYTGSASPPDSWVLKLWISHARIFLIGGTFAYAYNMLYTRSS